MGRWRNLVDALDLEKEMFFLINLFNRILQEVTKFLLYLCVYKNIHNELKEKWTDDTV